MKSNDLFSYSLEGVTLIEAAAGTGKTYTLAGLYLRMLLERGLQPSQVLVITFTDAATAELRKKIRDLIIEAREALIHKKTKDAFLADWLARYPEDGQQDMLRLRLTAVLTGFDEAAIHTIHGFCARLLSDHAFAGGLLYDTQTISTQAQLEKQFVEDFWRRHVYSLHPLVVGYALARKFNHDELYKLMSMVLKKADLRVLGDFKAIQSDTFEKAVTQINEKYRAWVDCWTAHKDDIIRCLKDKALSGVSYGRHTDSIVMRIENQWRSGRIVFPLDDNWMRISADTLVAKTKKNEVTPCHRFFDLSLDIRNHAQQIEADISEHLSYLKKIFVHAVQNDFPKLKEKNNVMYFDDLLLRARRAMTEPGAQKLAAMLSAQYRAVLVDEFQDTDPVQYAIIDSIFIQNTPADRRSVFLIGDPKQSIYSFRGADIFAYLRAAETVDEKRHLKINWRSESPLISAVNALFDQPNHPFVYPGIDYFPVIPAARAQELPLMCDSQPGASVEWWFVPSADEGEPIGVGKARKIILEALVHEIHALLEQGRCGRAAIGHSPVTEKDIAVLVRSNAQAVAVRNALNRVGIPTVMSSAESVFLTPEAAQLKRWVQGILRPDREGWLLAALTTDFHARTAIEIASDLEDDEQMTRWKQMYVRLQQLWHAQGFLAMFGEFVESETLASRIAAYADGERRLTNYWHLAELIGRAEETTHLTPSDLPRWLDLMAHDANGIADDRQLRLETDLNCVRIVTIHKSKGLEFPIVFCPFAWETDPPSTGLPLLCFHDETTKQSMADLGLDDRERHRALYEREALSENCRLLYVALTRAKHRVYFAWGNIAKTRKSAATYLFHRWRFESESKDNATDARMLDDIRHFVSASFGAIRLQELQRHPLPPPWVRDLPDSVCNERVLGRNIEQHVGITSYSALIQNRHDAFDATQNWDEGITGYAPAVKPVYDDTETLLSFPPGPVSGALLHHIMEHVDLSRQADMETKTQITRSLDKYGYDAKWETAIRRMLSDLARINLAVGDKPDFSLSDIDPQANRKEMEFHIPIDLLSANTLNTRLQQSPLYQKHKGEPAARRWLEFSRIKGFLKGFMDLVFEHRGRYYIVDWKSNDLGSTHDDYQIERLEEVMLNSFYDLQYLIYTLALNRHLACHLPDYSYDRHFGGVYYLFLRGINALGGRSGIYFDRPDVDFVEGLLKP